MSTLYELTNDYMNLLELAEDPDIDEQVLSLTRTQFVPHCCTIL